MLHFAKSPEIRPSAAKANVDLIDLIGTAKAMPFQNGCFQSKCDCPVGCPLLLALGTAGGVASFGEDAFQVWALLSRLWILHSNPGLPSRAVGAGFRSLFFGARIPKPLPPQQMVAGEGYCS